MPGRIRRAVEETMTDASRTAGVWEQVGAEVITNGVRLTGSVKLKGIPAKLASWLGLSLSLEFDTVVKLGEVVDESPGAENVEAGGN